MANHPEKYEKAHERVFAAIMDYKHPDISCLDAEFIADDILHVLGRCRGKACRVFWGTTDV